MPKKAKVLIGLILLISQPSLALVTLKQVQVMNGKQVELLFDSKIKEQQIQTDFFKDTIQISLNNVSVYPAKISSVNNGTIKKVFTYQYSPKLVRCRLTINGDAESFKDRVKINSEGNILSIKLKDGVSDQLTLRAAKSEVQAPTAQASLDKLRESEFKEDEKILLNRVLKDKPLQKDTKLLDNPENNQLRSPTRVLLKLLAVLALFLIGMLALKRFIQKKGSGFLSTGTPLGKFVKKKFGAKGKMVEVIATHYLGPKKSISVVKVAGRVLVLGVTEDAVNLITELPADGVNSALGLADELTGNSEIDSEIANLGPLSKYDEMRIKGKKPEVDSFSAVLNQQSDIRSKIKNKLEGFKPL